MTTQILNLPHIDIAVSTSNDADWRMAFMVMSPDASDVLQAVDLRDITYLLRVWRTPSGGHEILLASQDGELSITGASHNVFNVAISALRMSKVPLGDWPFEIIATAEGATMELVNGTLTHGADGGSLITSIASVPRIIAEATA